MSNNEFKLKKSLVGPSLSEMIIVSSNNNNHYGDKIGLV